MQIWGQRFSSVSIHPPLGFFSPGLSSVRTVSTAANPAATAAAFAAFFAVPLTLRVIEPERFLPFATVFGLVRPRFRAVAPARFADFFEERFDAFAMLPPKIFKAMDSNKDGRLTREEMQAFMQGMRKAAAPQ